MDDGHTDAMFRLLPVAALAFSSLAASADSPPASLPKPKWVVFYAENSCVLIRPRSGSAAGIRIESRPYEAGHELQFLLPKDGRGGFMAIGQLSVPSTRSSAPTYMSVEELRYSPDRRVKTAISSAHLDLVAKEGSLGVTIPNRVDALVSTPGLAKALLAKKKCEGGLALKWGAPRTWSVDPAPNVEPMTIFRSSDYPTSLVNANVQGDARVLIKIGAAGETLECRSISRNDLKQFIDVVCKVIRKRVKFTPAKDTAGRPVESYYVLPKVKFRSMG